MRWIEESGKPWLVRLVNPVDYPARVEGIRTRTSISMYDKICARIIYTVCCI